MGIPQKNNKEALNRNNPIRRLGRGIIDGVLSIPDAILQIPKLPRKKLLRLWGFFLVGSGFSYFMFGPFRRIVYMR